MKVERFDLRKISDSRGSLSFVENGAPLPFDIDRVVYIRGEEVAHFTAEEILCPNKLFAIALSGSCSIRVSADEQSEDLRIEGADCGVCIHRPYSQCDFILSADAVVLLLLSLETQRAESAPEKIGQSSKVDQCRIVELNRNDLGVSLTNGCDLSFNVKRAYYLYEVPAEEKRGAHAHKELYQLIIPLNGSFDVELDDGRKKQRFALTEPNKALQIVPGMWRDIENFSSKDTICLVLASMLYSEADYIRDYEDFLDYKTL